MIRVQASTRLRGVAIVILMCGICAVYFLRSYGHGLARDSNGNSAEFYAMLANAFLAGKTSLPVVPPPELQALPDPYDPHANAKYRMHDASLYKGKYYCYFGPVPALLLFLPYRLVTHADLRQDLAVPVFCSAGFLVSCALLSLLVKRERWEWPFWLESASILLLGTCTFCFFLLRRPFFYEVTIAAGYFLVMAGFLFFSYGSGSSRRYSVAILLAGLCFGLSVGCRPDLVVMPFTMVALLVVLFRAPWRTVGTFLAPLAVCAVFVACYNYVRFDDPFEFGMTYQLTGGSGVHRMPLNINTMGRSLYLYLLPPPIINRTFPFAHPMFIVPSDRTLLPSTAPGIPSGYEPTAGLLSAVPLVALALCAPLLIRPTLSKPRSGDSSTPRVIWLMYASSLAVLFALAATGWVVGRYVADFAPPLILVTCVLLGLLWQRIPKPSAKARAFLFGVVSLASFCVVLNLLMAAPNLSSIRDQLGPARANIGSKIATP